LGENNSVLVLLNGHTEKMVKRSKILHGKFLLQGCDDTLKKLHKGSSEDNIVHIQE
jgi:hypothetical protein